MTKTFKPLSYNRLDGGVGYQRPRQDLPERITVNSPAIDTMTDLTKVAAITVSPCASIDEAGERMVASGVRLLLVTDQYNKIIGLLTLTDLQGEKPMKYLREFGGRREEILVRDIMTAQSRLEVMRMADVAKARVGDIVETFKRMGRQHALVTEVDSDGQEVVRGIFSTKQLTMQLGERVEAVKVANSFADLMQI